MINDTDQWLLEGNCDLCRRNNYCTHRCKISRSQLASKMNEVVSEALLDVLSQKSINNEGNENEESNQ